MPTDNSDTQTEHQFEQIRWKKLRESCGFRTNPLYHVAKNAVHPVLPFCSSKTTLIDKANSSDTHQRKAIIIPITTQPRHKLDIVINGKNYTYRDRHATVDLYFDPSQSSHPGLYYKFHYKETYVQGDYCLDLRVYLENNLAPYIEAKLYNQVDGETECYTLSAQKEDLLKANSQDGRSIFVKLLELQDALYVAAMAKSNQLNEELCNIRETFLLNPTQNNYAKYQEKVAAFKEIIATINELLDDEIDARYDIVNQEFLKTATLLYKPTQLTSKKVGKGQTTTEDSSSHQELLDTTPMQLVPHQPKVQDPIKELTTLHTALVSYTSIPKEWAKLIKMSNLLQKVINQSLVVLLSDSLKENNKKFALEARNLARTHSNTVNLHLYTAFQQACLNLEVEAVKSMFAYVEHMIDIKFLRNFLPVWLQLSRKSTDFYQKNQQLINILDFLYKNSTKYKIFIINPDYTLLSLTIKTRVGIGMVEARLSTLATLVQMNNIELFELLLQQGVSANGPGITIHSNPAEQISIIKTCCMFTTDSRYIDLLLKYGASISDEFAIEHVLVDRFGVTQISYTPTHNLISGLNNFQPVLTTFIECGKVICNTPSDYLHDGGIELFKNSLLKRSNTQQIITTLGYLISLYYDGEPIMILGSSLPNRKITFSDPSAPTTSDCLTSEGSNPLNIGFRYSKFKGHLSAQHQTQVTEILNILFDILVKIFNNPRTTSNKIEILVTTMLAIEETIVDQPNDGRNTISKYLLRSAYLNAARYLFAFKSTPLTKKDLNQISKIYEKLLKLYEEEHSKIKHDAQITFLQSNFLVFGSSCEESIQQLKQIIPQIKTWGNSSSFHQANSSPQLTYIANGRHSISGLSSYSVIKEEAAAAKTNHTIKKKPSPIKSSLPYKT